MRILVVEDERESREGLCTTLAKLGPDEEIYSADSGVEALRLLNEAEMDLIFLDIRMPEMDGLTLLEHIRERNISASIIMLSAYDQFSYAQRAIRLGAMDFIVKPYTEEAIAQVLDRLQSQGSKEEDGFFMPDITQWLLHPASHADMIAARLRLPSTEVYTGRIYMLRVFNDDGSIHVSRQSKMLKWLYRRVRAAVPADAHVLMLDSEGVFPMVLFSEGGCELDEERLMNWLEEASDRFGARVCCMIGREEKNILGSLRQSYTRCKAQMEYAFYLSVPCVVSEGALQTDPKRQVDARLIEALKERVLKGDGDAACQALNDLRTDALRPPFMPVQRLLYTLHMEFINLLGTAGANMTSARRMELAEQMGAIAQKDWRIDGFFAAYRELTERLADCVSDLRTCQNQATVQRCLEYLQQNYSDPELTQEMMARKLHFSAGYFGNMFKQATGESFVSYLNRLRVSEAQNLLTNSYLKVYEIAEQTGFASVNYFIRVFKQYTQMSPNRYRMLYASRSDKP